MLYRFLSTGDVGSESEEWSYAYLDRRARSLGALLQEMGATGKRALLLYAPGLEFIAAFMGCLYGGTIAVPCYPPDPSRLGRSLPRLRAIAMDCEAEVVLTTSSIAGLADALMPQAPELAGLRWIATDAQAELADSYRQPAIHGHSLAFLQYTSGSTSDPRGVMISHANVLHNQRLIERGFGHDSSTVGVSWLPMFHDMGLIGKILQPLYLGIPCVLMSPLAFLQRPLRWLEAISHFRATTSGGPNFAYDLCARKVSAQERASLDLSSWSVAFNAAEPIRKETIDRFSELFAPCGFRREAFYACYGLAEATLIVSGGRRRDAPIVAAFAGEPLRRRQVVETPADDTRPHDTRWLVSSGRCAPELDIAIVDPDSQARCGPDQVGEIWVRGPSIGQGYWNRPEDTARTFFARLAGTSEGPFLRTGDLGFLRDGELYIAGRLKDVVIVAGRNHYPQDIEATVERAHAGVRPGCCAAFSVERDGMERLVVAAELEPSRAPEGTGAVIRAIRSAVSDEHGVAVHAVALLEPRTVAKTSSGKIQRHACRQGYLSGTWSAIAIDEDHERVAPRNAMEASLAAMVAEVLGVERVGMHDDFFALGGHSLAAMQVVARVRDTLHIELPLRDLFERPTVATLAEMLEERLGRGATEIASPEGSIPAMTRVADRQSQPLSYAQERFWVFSQLDPSGFFSNMMTALRLEGELDRAALEASVQELVARHEILRTTIHGHDEGPRQVIRERMLLAITAIDLGHLSEDERDAAMRAEAASEERRAFILEHGPLLRVRLLRMARREHVLFLTTHHLIADAWTVAVFMRELAVLYQAFVRRQPSPLPAVELHYADYAVWHRQWLDSGVIDAELAYWRRKLQGAPTALDLPADRPRPSRPWGPGKQWIFEIPAPLMDSLQALGRRQGVTLFMTLQAAFLVLLSRYTGEEDIVLAMPIAGRLRAETESMLGLFLNLLVLRTDLSGAPTFEELLARVKETSLEAYTHQHVPFERLVRALVPERDPWRTPWTQVVFNLQNTPAVELVLPDVQVTPLDLDSEIAKFDLSLELSPRAGGLVGRFHYRAELFEEATIERMARHYRNLLEAVIQTPGARIRELDPMTGEERAQVLFAWNDTDVDPASWRADDISLHELVMEQAARAPDALAVWSEREQLTYGQLQARAQACARALAALGIAPEQPVAVCMHRTPAWVPWVLGILMAGGAYMPLSPDEPQGRIQAVLAGAGATIVITEAVLRGLFEGFGGRVVEGLELPAIADDEPRGPCSAEQIAYIIHTSGSTGQPRGVLVSHRAVCNHLLHRQRAFPLGRGDRFVHKAAAAFDIAIWELFAPLIAGATVLLARPEGQRDSSYIARLVVGQEATDIHFPPFMLEAFLKVPASRTCRSVRRVFCGGERMSAALEQRFHELMPWAELIHQYGPTETTIDATMGAGTTDRAVVSMGRPIANTRVYVLDAHLGPVPMGVAGELYIGGAGLARGYLGAPAHTAARFVPDPFGPRPGMRLYRTGDRARWLANGTLEFMGRLDHQVKIRGYRVELGEIEVALRDHPGIAEAVALVRDHEGQRRLIAYVTPRAGEALDQGSVRAFLQPRVPEYMIPIEVIAVDALPSTATGKVDRRALLALEREARETHERLVAPRTEIERVLCEMFTEVLGVAHIGVEDDFFARGGDSLAAASLISRITEHFGLELDLGVFFDTPSVAMLAANLEAGAPSAASFIVPLKASGSRPPLFCLHSSGGHLLGYYHLAAHMHPERPVYGVQSRALDDLSREFKSMNEMAARYAAAIRETQPQGPYYLFGWCFGGILAMSIAQALESEGQVVAFVGMFEVYPRDALPRGVVPDPLRGAVMTFGGAFVETFEALPGDVKAELYEALKDLSAKQQIAYIMEWARPRGLLTDGISMDFLDRQQGLTWIHAELARNYPTPVVDAPIYQWWARDLPDGFDLDEMGGEYPSWASHTRSGAVSEVVDGNHFTALRPPWCAGLARTLEQRLLEATERAPRQTESPRGHAGRGDQGEGGEGGEGAGK